MLRLKSTVYPCHCSKYDFGKQRYASNQSLSLLMVLSMALEGKGRLKTTFFTTLNKNRWVCPEILHFDWLRALSLVFKLFSRPSKHWLLCDNTDNKSVLVRHVEHIIHENGSEDHKLHNSSNWIWNVISRMPSIHPLPSVSAQSSVYYTPWWVGLISVPLSWWEHVASQLWNETGWVKINPVDSKILFCKVATN